MRAVNGASTTVVLKLRLAPAYLASRGDALETLVTRNVAIAHCGESIRIMTGISIRASTRLEPIIASRARDRLAAGGISPGGRVPSRTDAPMIVTRPMNRKIPSTDSPALIRGSIPSRRSGTFTTGTIALPLPRAPLTATVMLFEPPIRWLGSVGSTRVTGSVRVGKHIARTG